ncbi:hypothetical protein ACH5RR_003501 [Cinchona calisaya]|uniref:Uncharacterized protein n=1 Tax=Cinchona calisaya TaxID=153742 RepID=A0ABD3AV71_9GENT
MIAEMERKYAEEIYELKNQVQQLAQNLSSKQGELNKNKTELDQMKASQASTSSYLSPLVSYVNQFLRSSALKKDLCQQASTLGFKEGLEEVKEMHLEYLLVFSSFSNYDESVDCTLIIELDRLFLEPHIKENVLKEVLVKDSKDDVIVQLAKLNRIVLGKSLLH